MKSKFMAFLAAGLTLSAFTWISAAPPAEAQACNSNAYNNGRAFNNRRALKRFKKQRINQRRAFRNNVVPVNANPFFANGNGYYNQGNGFFNNNTYNPYNTNNGVWGTIRNLF